MNGRLIIEYIEFQCNIGVTAQERGTRQPIGVDLELDYPSDRLILAASTDRIENAIDYSTIVQRIVQIGSQGEYHLVERLAERLLHAIFLEFPVIGATIWVRKLMPPLPSVGRSVGIRLSQQRTASRAEGAPADLLVQHAASLPKGRALDVAAGRGRNSLYLAALGFSVDAVDRDEAALQELRRTAGERGLSGITIRPMDLEDPQHPVTFPRAHYDVIAVFYYLYRPLFPSLAEALAPGSVLLYETFLIDNHERYGHPRRREFCLQHNELLGLARGLRVVSYEEGERANGHNQPSVWTARLIARKEG